MQFFPPINNTFYLYLSLVLLVSPFSLSAQSVVRCGSDLKMQEIYDRNPEYRQQTQDKFDKFNSVKNRERRISTSTIAVHVIILHSQDVPVGMGNNLSFERIESQIDVLTDDFTRNNSDQNNTPPEFSAASADIDFCLVGVTRYVSEGMTDANEFTIKQETGWDNSAYLNIWVSPNLPNGLLGWAYLPNISGPVLDGVVVLTGAFGGPGQATFAPYNLGRTATHEVGHYLGLRHVWGDGGCNSDDGINDTPVQFDFNDGCPMHPSPSCPNNGDMFMNYMDYVNDACMNAFTQDQVDYMNDVLNTDRSGLTGTSCSFIDNISIELLDSEDVTCHGGSDGFLEVEATDGEPPYNYTLQQTGESNNNGFFDNLEAGNYTIMVEDNEGSSTEIVVDILEPNPFFTSVTILEEVSCIGAADGEVDIAVAGGNGNFDFDVPGQGLTSDSKLTGLAAGEYVITVTDDEGCEAFIDFELDAPDTLRLLVDTLITVGCYGDSNGSIEVESSGGTGFVSTYQILADGTNVEDTLFTGLAQDTFTFFAEDFNGCTDTAQIVMTQPDSLELLLDSLIPPTCFGDSTAMLILAPSGGNTQFTYLYDTFTLSNDTVTNLYADSFLITAIDENNCMDTTTFIIDNPEANQVLISELMDVQCGGATLGSAELASTSIHSPIAYTLGSDTNESGLFDGLSEGDYLASATDTLGCEATVAFSLTTSGGAEISVTDLTDILCAGDNDGSLTVMATGGSDFTYSLDGINYQDENNFTDLAAADYTVYVLDADDCVTQEMVTITAPEPLVLTLVGKSDNLCNGGSSGEAILELSGGTGQSQILINGQAGSLTLSDLVANTYTVEAIDENACTTSLEFTIEEPNGIEVTSFSSTMSTCSGNTGTISLEAIGGNGQLTYLLDGDEQTVGEFNNLPSQIYTVIVRDEDGCSLEQVIEVGQAADIELAIVLTSDESCFGANDGYFGVEVDGGTGALSYLLNNDPATVADFSNLSPGDYIIGVADDEGCSDFEMVTIEEATPLTLELIASVDMSCSQGSDGEISVQASGGRGPYTYTINNEQSNTSGVFTGLDQLQYQLSVLDKMNCEATLTVILEVPDPIELLIIDSFSPNCSGGNDGSVSLQASGGTNDYTYTIAGTSNSTGIIENLVAGTYEILIEDSNGCQGIGEVTVEDILPVELLTSSQTAPTCQGNSDGTVMLSGAGGYGNYTYSIDGQSDENGLISDLSAGTYTVNIRDINGCEGTGEITIEEGPVVDLVITTESTTPSCQGNNDATLTLTVTTGTGDYSYTLGSETNTTGLFENLSAGTYTAEVSDDNACSQAIEITIQEGAQLEYTTETLPTRCADEASGTAIVSIVSGNPPYEYTLNGSMNTEGTFDNLAAGDYVVAIRDANGCQADALVTIEDAEAINVTDVITLPTDCFGTPTGAFTLSVEGGTGSYMIEFDGQVIDGAEASNLIANDYQVIISDQNGCSITQSLTIEDAPQLELDLISEVRPSCAGDTNGALQVIASGGNGGYEYSLLGNLNTTGNFTDLAADTYTIEVSDDNGCTVSQSVTLADPSTIEVSDVLTQPTLCADSADGSVILITEGGTGDLEYSLEDGVPQLSSNFGELNADQYTVYITDQNGCEVTTEFIIENATPIDTQSVTISPVDLEAGVDGSIIAEIVGGTGPYTYSLDGVTYQASNQLDNVEAGSQTLFVLDDNDCLVTFDLSVENASVCGGTFQDQIVDVSISPNPVTNTLNMAFCSSSTQEVTYVLYDDRGRLISNMTRLYSSGPHTDLIDVTSLPVGIYVIGMTSLSRTHHYRFAKIE